MKLSIVIPVYNELSTIEAILKKVSSVDFGLEAEIILVDDCSQDGTRERMKELEAEYPNAIFDYHAVNRGKGAALRTAAETFSTCARAANSGTTPP